MFKILKTTLEVVGLITSVSTLSCSASTSSTQKTFLTFLPPYEGREKTWFDDSLEPSTFGLTLKAPQFRGNADFRGRAQAADWITRMKITTVTIDQGAGSAVYHLHLAQREKALRKASSTKVLDIDVRPGSHSYGIMQQYEVTLQNRIVIVFGKTFRQESATSVHWYIVPDNEDVLSAVKEAIVLQELASP